MRWGDRWSRGRSDVLNQAIEVQGLTKYYGHVLAVDAIDFSVRGGEIFGFLGPNGAGKTTTQRMLMTLLEPSAGRIFIFGHDLSREPDPVKRVMGLVPEESSTYAELSAWDNLMFTGQLYGMTREDRQRRARELLDLFGLWDKRDVKAEAFSRGMRRRLSIAMAVIHDPKLLFLDEPTAGLDAQSKRIIHWLIGQLNAQGATIFLTTHEIEEANQLCGRVAIINQGRIATIDTPERLKEAFRRVQLVEVALHPDGKTHEKALGALPGVAHAARIGDKWRLYTETPSAVVTEVVHYAEAHGLSVVHLATLGPSLEDVFLEITGGKPGAERPDSAEGQLGPRARRET
jgi:ABC-2 type transport system ATP-binding protein